MFKTKNYLKKAVPNTILETLRERRAISREEKMIQKSLNSANSLVQNKSNCNILKLEIGAGRKKGTNGWITIDMNTECDMYWNLLNPLPFPENTADVIYSSHVMEHFYYDELIALLNNCYKTLKPNGIFSACVPDASIYINAYVNSQELDPQKYCRYSPAFNYFSKIDLINYIAYMDGHHKYMFDSENLVKMLEKVGFSNVQLRQFDSKIDKLERDYQSIYVKAIK